MTAELIQLNVLMTVVKKQGQPVKNLAGNDKHIVQTFLNSCLWLAVSKAAEMSNPTSTMSCFWSIELYTLSRTRSKVVSVEWPALYVVLWCLCIQLKNQHQSWWIKKLLFMSRYQFMFHKSVHAPQLQSRAVQKDDDSSAQRQPL